VSGWFREPAAMSFAGPGTLQHQIGQGSVALLSDPPLRSFLSDTFQKVLAGFHAILRDATRATFKQVYLLEAASVEVVEDRRASQVQLALAAAGLATGSGGSSAPAAPPVLAGPVPGRRVAAASLAAAGATLGSAMPAPPPVAGAKARGGPQRGGAPPRWGSGLLAAASGCAATSASSPPPKAPRLPNSSRQSSQGSTAVVSAGGFGSMDRRIKKGSATSTSVASPLARPDPASFEVTDLLRGIGDKRALTGAIRRDHKIFPVAVSIWDSAPMYGSGHTADDHSAAVVTSASGYVP
jgi:hypothetical protein